MLHQTIDINKLTQKQKEFNLSDEMLSKVLGFDDKKLEKIRLFHSVHNSDDYLSIMNFLNMGKKKLKITLNKINEEEKRKAEEEKQRIEEEKQRIEEAKKQLAREKARERARKLHEEKKAKEFIEANRKESREATFRSRLKAIKESIQKSKSEVFLKNRKFVTKPMNKSDEREYSTGNFVRVPKGTDISELTDFYYRFSRSYNVSKESIHVELETYLRHIINSYIGRDNIEYYYNRGDVEVFLKVKEFPQTREKEEISTKEEYGQNVSR